MVAAICFFVATLKFKGQTIEIKLKEFFYYALLLIAISTILQIHFPNIRISGQNFAGGGVLGSLFSQFLIHYLNAVGAEIVAVTGLVLSFVLATHLKISSLSINAYRLLKYFGFPKGNANEKRK